jgi:prepilin-type processing-associated H-X9-DG protein
MHHVSKMLGVRVNPAIAIIAVLAVLVIVFSLLSPRIGRGTISRQFVCRTNLRTIGVALAEYNQRWGCFPPAFVADESGSPMYSWRLLLLPHLDQEPLYNAYNFGATWDSRQNRTVASVLVETYLCPSQSNQKGGPMTSYLAVVGPDTLWPGSTCIRQSYLRTTSQSHVIQVIEVVDSGIHWSEPRDLLSFEMESGINGAAGRGLASKHPGGAHALFLDGTVRFLGEPNPPADIKRLVQIVPEKP